MTDYLIEIYDAKNNFWQPYATNTSREWAERDVARYQQQRPECRFRVSGHEWAVNDDTGVTYCTRCKRPRWRAGHCN